MSSHENARFEERSQRAWAVVRIALGMTQVMGATATVYWLALSGADFLTIGGLAVTIAALMRLPFRMRQSSPDAFVMRGPCDHCRY